MWQKIKDKDYFLSFIQSHDYEICVTDFVSIWTATFSEKAFIAQLKNSNDGLLLESDKEYIDNGFYLLNIGIDTLKHVSLEENGDHLLLTMRTVIEYPFGFECKLSKGSNEFFFKEVTQPLLEAVSDLKSSEHGLIQILTKKDKEIKAYKRELENKEIIFRHEVTKAFSDAEHKKVYKIYDKIFGSETIPKSVLLRSIKLPQKPLAESIVPDIRSIKREADSIKQEQDNIKREPDSIKQEPDNTTQETTSIKEESSKIKQEQCTPVFENQDSPLVTKPASCKQDIIKPEGSQTRSNERRKRLKLSY
ncbi:unnamed protein product [Arctia plantaginis]|uniref:Non-homologous end-joining factor 1 n=1 Tax=Arctia plantaginis TaxID=874455 RepID=A0A8S0ZUQ7_ARCPL|nr:unnamed protein product [Arctia plantaginis]